MPGALEVDAHYVRSLKGAGGAPFRDFMKQLIRAHGYALHFRMSDIISDSENMADGGCDTEVRAAEPQDVTGYCANRTCWQFKGTDKASLTPKKLREEVQKDYAKRLIGEGYTYCLAVADDISAESIQEMRDTIASEIRTINDSAPAPIVLGATALGEWATQYPGLALARTGKAGSFLSIEAWEANVTVDTQRYVDNPEWQNAKDVLTRHVDFASDASTATIRVRGDAGVGKTRLVYETIKDVEGAPRLCLYTMQETAVVELAYLLSNTKAMFALLIADECLNKTRRQLEQTLQGCRDRVRVIVINNTDEPSYEQAPDPELRKLPDEILQKILEENFPAVPAEERRAALSLAEGFVRIAADLCRHGFTGGMQHLGGYLDARVDNSGKRRVMEAISLFERVGAKAEFADELAAVAKLVGTNEQELRELALAVKSSSPGFIVAAGRYLYVTPEAIAQICFARAWEKWVAPDVRRFYTSLPPTLAESFARRVSKSAPAKAREEFAAAQNDIAEAFQSPDLVDKKKTEEFLRLVETSPNRFLPRLRQIVERASHDVLATSASSPDGWGARRKIVWTCEHLAPFPEYFYDVEAILLQLAVHETEPTIGNNATAIWQQLFRLHLPGTAVPFRERVALLKTRIENSDANIARLAIAALRGIFATHVSRMGGPPVVGGRIPPADWHPESFDQEHKCLMEALRLLRQALLDHRDAIRSAAANLFVDEVRLLLSRGFFEFVRDAIDDANLPHSYLPKTLDQADDFLQFDAPRWPTDYVEQIRNWRLSLVPETDFLIRLRAIIGRSRRWTNDDAEKAALAKEINALVQAFLQQPQVSDEALDWLFSDQATHAFEFGESLGRLDSGLKYFDTLRAKSVLGDAPLIRGYILGVATVEGNLPQMIQKWLNQLEGGNPNLLYAIASSLPHQTNGFHIVMRLFSSGKIPPRYINGLQFRLGTDFTRERLIEMLSALLSYRGPDEEQALVTAVDVAASWIEDPRRHKSSSLADDSALWPLVRAAIDRATPKGTMDVYHWANVLHAVSRIDPSLVTRKAIQALGEAGYISERATAILIEVAKTRPDLVMQQLGAAVLSDEFGWKLRIGGFADILAAIPSGIVMEWLRHHGIDAARRIASNLPRPYLSDSGEPIIPEVTERVLAEFGSDETVKNEFAVPSGFRSYSGDIVGLHLKEAEFAEKFLHHPLEPIRFWARVEKEGALHEADRWKQRIAEQRW